MPWGPHSDFGGGPPRPVSRRVGVRHRMDAMWRPVAEGAGCAVLFAALTLAEAGLEPVLKVPARAPVGPRGKEI